MHGRISFCALLLVALSQIISYAAAVFVDDAYQSDFHLALMGIPQQSCTFFHRPHSASKASLLYTLSEKHILGAVNPKDGSLVWRQNLALFSNGTQSFLKAGEGDATIVSALGSDVSSWDALSGKLVWSSRFAGASAKSLVVMELEDAHHAGDKDVLVLFNQEAGGIVRKLSGETGEVIWEYEDPSDDVSLRLSTSASKVFLISLHGVKIKVTTLDPVNGRRLAQHLLSSDGHTLTPKDILFVGVNVAAPALAWIDHTAKALKINIIGSKNINSFSIERYEGNEGFDVTLHAPQTTRSLPHFLVHYQTAESHWADVFHVDLHTSAIKKAYSLPNVRGKGAFSTSHSDGNVYFVRDTDTEVILASSASHGILARWPKKAPNSSESPSVLHAVSGVISKSDATFAVRSASLLSNGDWQLVRNGEFAWARAEGLAGAVAAAWAEPKEEVGLAKELEVEGHKNPLAAYIHRCQRHARELQHLPSWIQNLPTRIPSSFSGDKGEDSESAALHRDSFGFRKLALIAADNGRLYALDTGSQGKILWNVKAVSLAAGKKWDVKGIHVDNAESTVFIKDCNGEGVLADSLTGEIIRITPGATSQPVESTALLDGIEGSKYLLSVYNNGRPEAIPENALARPGSVLVVQLPQGDVQGLRYSSGAKAPIVAWEFRPASGERIIHLTTRPLHDPVASIGKVLGNRFVFYKYLNHNLLLISAISEAKSTASFYLLDSISGELLYSTSHAEVDTSSPVTAALSENWLSYSLRSESASQNTSKGFEIIIAELYESHIPNDRGPLGAAANYSATSPSLLGKPFVISQAFVIPEEISGMAVTQTRQGITSRQLLVTLRSSNALFAIPRNILNARRPVGRDPTPAEAEEGLFRYTPVIEFDPKFVLTHQREVVGIKDVITAPALLESTSLVLAYGLDVFGTRVAPSMAFDVLGKGFGKLQLLGTVAAVAVGVAILAPMVSLAFDN
ncbi:MAG: hypothetical protein M1829_000211 [Trizodia sp. TS-e1964]|nr:MAG: hypothetical protein M1829_000211 [Trizodia sp. TS-e1964]